MIFSCPACATRFALKDDAFSKGARKLRCAKCGHVWRSNATGEVLPPEPEVEVIAPEFPRFQLREQAPLTTPPLPPAAQSEWVQQLEKVAEKLPRLPYRLAWFLVLVLILVLTSILWFGRYRLTEHFPELEQVLVNHGLMRHQPLEKLDLELTKAEKCLVSGRDMLCLNGKVTNTAEDAMLVPSIYITALNAGGQPITDADGKELSWTIPAEKVTLLPGESRVFSLTEPYPDRKITDFDYGFIDQLR
jgi:predicted Zn finger-like uncharacterized protein